VKNYINCVRCGRRFRGVSLCLDCELFVIRQQRKIPGYKPQQRREALHMITKGEVARIRPGVWKVKGYKTARSACTCPSGRYRGMHAGVCKHELAVETLEARSE
jgi:hypothetical protein